MSANPNSSHFRFPKEFSQREEIEEEAKKELEKRMRVIPGPGMQDREEIEPSEEEQAEQQAPQSEDTQRVVQEVAQPETPTEERAQPDAGQIAYTERRISLHPLGALEAGDPRLFIPCTKDVDESDFESGEVQKAIDLLTDRLTELPYIAFAAPQFGYLLRLIVMYSGGEIEAGTGGELIPHQVWINPQWSPQPTSGQVLSWERYANQPESYVLVSRHESIRVAGVYRGPGEGRFRNVLNHKMEGWQARAMQALTPYLDGLPPQHQALHPAFTITYRAQKTYYRRSMAPFRLRGLYFDQPPVLDIGADLRKQVEPKIYEAWQARGRSGHSPTPIDIVGFIRFEEAEGEKDSRIVDGADETLRELLDEVLDRPQAMIERPAGEDALVRLFRMDQLPRQIDPVATTMVVVKPSPDVCSGGSMEAHDPSLSSLGGNTMIGSPADENSGTGESPLDNPRSKRIESQAAGGSDPHQTASPEAYKFSGHCIRFPTEASGQKAIRVLRDSPEPYSTVEPDLFLFSNNQIEALKQAGVSFEYVSESSDADGA